MGRLCSALDADPDSGRARVGAKGGLRPGAIVRHLFEDRRPVGGGARVLNGPAGVAVPAGALHLQHHGLPRAGGELPRQIERRRDTVGGVDNPGRKRRRVGGALPNRRARCPGCRFSVSERCGWRTASGRGRRLADLASTPTACNRKLMKGFIGRSCRYTGGSSASIADGQGNYAGRPA